ncbi:Uncharacterized protein APZ42_021675 [Daphnia magna]|uniref:Uncharacterized protein n=1 Tax=Daphnia magna TaxID=35525 RepID=A0A164WF90_9CRUS|nr:Uncharacterized protein APZ42_021675 [Daphnia magna]
MTRLNRRCRMANNRGVSPSSFRDSANKAPISDPLLSRSLRSSVTEPLLMAAKKSDCSFKDGLRRGVGPGSDNARGVAGKRNQIHRQTRRGGTESSVGESIMNAGKIDDDYGESITMPYIPLLFPCVERIVIFSIGIIVSILPTPQSKAITNILVSPATVIVFHRRFFIFCYQKSNSDDPAFKGLMFKNLKKILRKEMKCDGGM